MSLKSLLLSRQKLSDSTALSSFYSGEIDKWNEIYNGGGDWRYVRKGGLNGGTRKRSSLGAAKAVCAELTRLCFTEGTDFICSDRETEAYLKKYLPKTAFLRNFQIFSKKFSLSAEEQ